MKTSQLEYKSGSLVPAHSSFCDSTMDKRYSLEQTLDFLLDESDNEEHLENADPDNPEEFTTDTEDETEFQEDYQESGEEDYEEEGHADEMYLSKKWKHCLEFYSTSTEARKSFSIKNHQTNTRTDKVCILSRR